MRPDSKASVLIVDNDDQILCKFQEMLENAGFDTTATWSGYEALGLLKSGEFNVLLVDDYLPDLHSHDFLERVNSLPIRPSIVVMHSEAAKPDLLLCYESKGVSELVDKRDPLRVRQAVSFCCAEQQFATKRLN